MYMYKERERDRAKIEREMERERDIPLSPVGRHNLSSGVDVIDRDVRAVVSIRLR